MNADYHLFLPFPCSDTQSAWTASGQMVTFQSSSLSGPTVSSWYTSPEWLISIRLLSFRPSTSLYHSTAILHIVLNDFYPTGHSWCQSRVTSYKGDDGWCHPLSLSMENIAMCVCTGLTQHCNCDNTRGWVVMWWSRDLYPAVIGGAIMLAFNWLT